jgi:D-alanyl-D-alanine carboxypeptidase
VRTALTRRAALAATLLLVAGCSSSRSSAEPGATEPASAPTPAPTVTAAPPTTTVTLPPSTATPTTSSTTTSPPTTTTVAPRFDADAFDLVVRAATVERGARAVGVAVVKDGTLVHEAAYGVEDPATARPATTSSRFRLASISKVLTATVVMDLVEDGLLSLDDPALPRIAASLGVSPADPRISAVTVRQLLSHTSGFGPAAALYFDGGAATCHDAARVALSGALTWDPGSHFRYSNTNYCLLGLAIEAATGLPFEWVVDARLLHPLGITDMRLAGTHDVRPGDVVHPSGADRRYMEPLFAAGAWIGTASDVARILSTLVDAGGPLDAGSVTAMRTPISLASPDPEWTYGLGLRLWVDGSWGHTGTVEQTRAIVLATPQGYVVSVLVSGEVPPSDDLRAVVAYALVAATA